MDAITKVCTTCEIEKPTTEFYKDKLKKDGLYSRCKTCHSQSTSAWKKANKGQVNEQARTWRARNPERVKESQRRSNQKRYHANPEKFRSLSRAVYQKNKGVLSDYHAEYREKHAGKKREYAKHYYAQHADVIKQRTKERDRRVRLADLPKAAERVSRRNAKKLHATPVWGNPAKIREFYQIAADITKATGVEHEVDHMVPLQSKFVCGLHVEHNLQVLTSKQNKEKGNRYWPDCPDSFDYPKPVRRKVKPHRRR